MSTGETTTPPELPLPPDWNQTPEEWNEEFKRNWMNTRLGHEGFMLEKIARQQAIVEANARFAATGDSSQLAKEITPTEIEGDGMGVSIGNKEYHVHYEMPASNTNTTTSTVEATPQVGSSTTNTLGKLAAAGALLGAGGLGTLGAGLAIDYLTKPEPTVVVQPAQQDTDTNAGLRFKE